jgi:hypothetical protein
MHTKAGIKEKFVADLTEVANLMIKSPTTKDEGRVRNFKLRLNS